MEKLKVCMICNTLEYYDKREKSISYKRFCYNSNFSSVAEYSLYHTLLNNNST